MDAPEIYQLKVSLLGIKPLIWRRIFFQSENSLEDLHQSIQLSMGWEDYHLYSFTYGGQFFEFDGYTRPLAKLSSLEMKKGDTLLYVYDFGDAWKHLVELEDVVTKNPRASYPCCVGGKRACPPEDSGGASGYMTMQKILKNKKHPEYKETLEWVGKDFDPEHFDLEDVNDDIQSFFAIV